MKTHLKWYRAVVAAAAIPFGGIAQAQALGPPDSNRLPSAADASNVEPAPPERQPSSQVTPAAVKHGPLPPLPSHAPRYERRYDAAELHRSTAAAHTPGIFSALTGVWMHSTALGPLWVPHGTTATLVGGLPHAYLYRPSYGWGWHASPWGPGPFREGPWTVRPWISSGWSGPWFTQPGFALRIDF